MRKVVALFMQLERPAGCYATACSRSHMNACVSKAASTGSRHERLMLACLLHAQAYVRAVYDCTIRHARVHFGRRYVYIMLSLASKHNIDTSSKHEVPSNHPVWAVRCCTPVIRAISSQHGSAEVLERESACSPRAIHHSVSRALDAITDASLLM